MNLIVVALSGDRIIGVNGSIYKRIKIGNKVVLCTYDTDLAVHPDFRNRGVSNQMEDYFLEYVENHEDVFSYWATEVRFLIEKNKNLYPLFPYFMLHYSRIGDMGLHNRMNPTDSLSAYAKRLGLHAIKLLNDLRNTISPSPPLNKDIQVIEINEFDDRADAFWDAVMDSYDFIVERTREHLNWSYCDSRGGDYTIKLAEEEGRMLGYIVLKMDDSGEYPRGEIIDLLTIPGRFDAAHALLEDATGVFDDNGINMCTTRLLEGHPYERVFERHGFSNMRRKTHVFYYLPKEDEEFIEHVHETLRASDARKIHLAKGDFL
jgi:GNAT superfamily N-acetyltransferase